MKIFEMPVMNLYAPLETAFPIMKEACTSGVLVQAGPLFRLLRFDTIQNALHKDMSSLDEVDEFEPVQRVSSLDASTKGLNLDAPYTSEPQFNAFLDEVQRSFGVISETLGMATLVSRHEPLADMYIPAPPIVQCTNPKRPHYYPPNQRTPGQQTCSLCAYNLS